MPETFCDKLKFKKSQNNFDSKSFKKNLLLFSLRGLLLKCFIYLKNTINTMVHVNVLLIIVIIIIFIILDNEQNLYLKWYMKCFIYWTADMISSKLWSSQLWTQFKQLRIEAWKIKDFNRVSTRDLPIPVWRSSKLSYDATDVGSWSFVGSNEHRCNRQVTCFLRKFYNKSLREPNHTSHLKPGFT